MPHLLVGLALMGLGVWGIIAWWGVFGLVMRGVVPFAMITVGLVAILAAHRKGSRALPAKDVAASPAPGREPSL